MRLITLLASILILKNVSTEILIRGTTTLPSSVISTELVNSSNSDHDGLIRVSTPSHLNASELSNSTSLFEDVGDDSDGEVEEETSEDSEENTKLESDEAVDNNSDVSDEQNAVDQEEEVDKAVIASHINQTFGSKTFTCPRVKTDLSTGTSVGDLSPEDISFIASMGDGVPSGVGLFYNNMGVEYRGASFASGADGSLELLVTIPNILREFTNLSGYSHGASDKQQRYDLSVSKKKATTKDLPAQARELLSRFSSLYGRERVGKWTMVIIAIGTEELCGNCKAPHEKEIGEALDLLYTSLDKALVILLGPTHVSHQSKQKKNLLKYRCECSHDKPPGFMETLADQWTDVFMRFQREYDQKMTVRQTFGLLALPQLTVTSRSPDLLFHEKTPIINKKGHAYMSKWLWNRLMSGERYNLSGAILSTEPYFCPSTGCPYFRTTANMRKCEMITNERAKDLLQVVGGNGEMKTEPRRTRMTLYSIAISVVVISFIVVLILAIIIYNISKQSVRGRFDEIQATVAPHDPPKPANEAQAATGRKHQLTRQLARGTLDVPPTVYGKRSLPDRSESMQLLTEH